MKNIVIRPTGNRLRAQFEGEAGCIFCDEEHQALARLRNFNTDHPRRVLTTEDWTGNIHETITRFPSL